MLVYGKYECLVMQMLYVCVLCASCGNSQGCILHDLLTYPLHPNVGHKATILHDLQFVNAGRRCKRRPYRRGILQSQSHDCLIGSHECLILFTPCCCCCSPSKTYGRKWGRLQFEIFTEHHRRLESLEYFNVLLYIYHSKQYVLSFWTLRMPYYFYKVSHFFANTLCMCVMYLTSI